MKTESEIVCRKMWILAGALVVIAVMLAFTADAFVASWISSHASRAIKYAADFVSRIGDWPGHVALGLLGIGIAYLARRKDWARVFLAMLIACALAGIAARVITVATGRARPSVRAEAVWNGPRLSAKYHAFPSGHTASSSAFFAVLFLAHRKIGAPFLAVPALIAAARVFAAAHYLSDVIFASALGIVCALLSCAAIGCHPPDTS